MADYVELVPDIWISRGSQYRIEHIGLREGDYVRVGSVLAMIERADGFGASLASQYAGEIIKVLVQEGSEITANTPIAVLKINPHEYQIYDRYRGRVSPPSQNGKIFVVHGHDLDFASQVLSFLKKLDLDPISLAEEPNAGRTIIEKFETHADVAFAIILFSPDDLGADKKSAGSGILESRARQNVILELGYFIARLGRSHVCALRRGNVEVPSDIHGIGYVEFDKNLKWQKHLVKELRATGYRLDPQIVAED